MSQVAIRSYIIVNWYPHTQTSGFSHQLGFDRASDVSLEVTSHGNPLQTVEYTTEKAWFYMIAVQANGTKGTPPSGAVGMTTLITNRSCR